MKILATSYLAISDYVDQTSEHGYQFSNKGFLCKSLILAVSFMFSAFFLHVHQTFICSLLTHVLESNEVKGSQAFLKQSDISYL